MRFIYRQLKEGLEAIRRAKTQEEYMKGIKKLLELQTKIEIKLKKKEKENIGKKLQHLMGWYKSLWNGKPPEYFKFSNPDAIIGKHLKELIQIYEKNRENIETLKRDYEHFLETWKKGNRGILHFRSILPALKQSKPKSWTSSEYERGIEYYQKLIEQRLKEESEEQSQEQKEERQKFPFDEDDEIPF